MDLDYVMKVCKAFWKHLEAIIAADSGYIDDTIYPLTICPVCMSHDFHQVAKVDLVEVSESVSKFHCNARYVMGSPLPDSFARFFNQCHGGGGATLQFQKVSVLTPEIYLSPMSNFNFST